MAHEALSARREHGVMHTIWSLLRRPVAPSFRTDLFSGWVILILFLMQVTTGILLSIYYQPSPATVSDSMQLVMRDVGWGWLVRGVHHWASHAMIVLCALHLLRAFVRGAYRGMASPNWYATVLVFFLVVALTYTGDVLSWDQDTYWRLSRALDRLASFGGLFHSLALGIRGGEEVTATTLSRTYTAHSMFLPWLVWVLLVANLWFLARRMPGRQGGAQ